MGRDCCEAGPTVLTRRPHINFFCGADHLNPWRSERPALAGDTLTLVEAVSRAREIFGRRSIWFGVRETVAVP